MTTATIPDHVVVGGRPEVLERVRAPGKNLAIWVRDAGDLAPGLGDWLDGLSAAEIPNHQDIVSREAAPGVIRAACEATLPAGPLREALIVELGERVEAMFAFTGEALLKLRLDRLDGPACVRFHQDAVGIRLLCSYRGPGTEWVPDAAVVPAKLGRSLPNSEIVPEASEIRSLPRFAVGLLKGSDARDGTFGIVHRSPDAGPRMLLCVEPLTPRLRRELGLAERCDEPEDSELPEAELATEED